MTYAALPWLWHFVQKGDAGRAEYLLFLSWVLYCAVRPDGSGRYQDLALDLTAHHHSWLGPNERLVEADMPPLRELDAWLAFHEAEIASACLDAITDDNWRAVYLAVGPAALKEGSGMAIAMQYWSDGYDGEEMPDPALDPEGLADALADRIGPKNAALAGFLRARVARREGAGR